MDCYILPSAFESVPIGRLCFFFIIVHSANGVIGYAYTNMEHVNSGPDSVLASSLAVRVSTCIYATDTYSSMSTVYHI